LIVGYGIRHMTVVDNGKVSYSNPNRQCLYDYADCLSGDYKATIAARKLLQIVPHCEETIRGVNLTIPMPSHPYNPTKRTTETAMDCLVDEAAREKLDELVASHDVIFLLTDSREARWLPTVLARRYNKLLLNAAVGFDSYLVMRHATPVALNNPNSERIVASVSTPFPSPEVREREGCYFCQDIVAATNSSHNRTLDEQCTVTRIGLSSIVAGLMTEMCIALLHAMKQPSSSEKAKKQYLLEEIPHQIRGSIFTFQQLSLQTPAFPQCTACSGAIVQCYEQNEKQFVEEVCRDSAILEEESGLKKLLSTVDLDEYDYFEEEYQ